MRLGHLIVQTRRLISFNGYVRRTPEPASRGSHWPQLGQFEHQKDDCNGLKHIRYIKIYEFIIIPKKKKPPKALTCFSVVVVK